MRRDGAESKGRVLLCERHDIAWHGLDFFSAWRVSVVECRSWTYRWNDARVSS